VGLKGEVPKDKQQFVTTARASYIAAQNEPYQTALAALGYSKEIIDAALATLDAMTKADEVQAAAIGAATQATARRNDAIKALKAWMQLFDRVARVALKQRPDLRKKLGL